MRLDLSNIEHYQKIDGVFLSFLNFTETMRRLVNDNKTAEALNFIFNLYDATRDKPNTLSEHFLNGYSYLNQVNDYYLQLASQLATPITSVVRSITQQAYERFPWLSL